MQRVNAMGRKKAPPATRPAPHEVDSKLKINNSLLFLLSFHDKRIESLIGLQKKVCTGKICIGDEFLRSRFIAFSTSLVFDYDLRFYRNLEDIFISSSKKVYMKSFNNTKIRTLSLESVQVINLDHVENIRVDRLVLRNIEWPYAIIKAVLEICKPVCLELVNVHCKNMEGRQYNDLLNMLKASNLLELDVESSFLDVGALKDLIRNNKLRSVSYAVPGTLFAYKSRGPLLRRCVLDRPIGEWMLPVGALQSLDYLEIRGDANVPQLEHTSPALKYLKLVEVSITGSLIKMLQSQRAVYLLKCSFNAISYYDFARTLSGSLRSLYVESTQLPLDGITFLKETLSSCQVAIYGVTSFFVDKKQSTP